MRDGCNNKRLDFSTRFLFFFVEWVFPVTVPSKQKLLTKGSAQLRFCINFFSITSGMPPVCQGIWQLSHLRKYGGTSGFSFEAGSQAMGGVGIYRLETNHSTQIRELIDCVSHHRPLPSLSAFSHRSSSQLDLDKVYVNVPNSRSSQKRPSPLSMPASTPVTTTTTSATSSQTVLGGGGGGGGGGGQTVYENVSSPVSASLSSPSLSQSIPAVTPPYRNVVETPKSLPPYENFELSKVGQSESSETDSQAVGGARPSYVNMRRDRSTSPDSAIPQTSDRYSVNYVEVDAISGGGNTGQRPRQRTPRISSSSGGAAYAEVDIEATEALRASVQDHDRLREESLKKSKQQ